MRFVLAGSPGYRRDIDGLRAIAVLAVVGYHAAPTLVPGGFAGVDAFFVISGYLITQQLLQVGAPRAADLRDFYGRRVRRIVPALLVVLVSVAAIGWIALSPGEYAALQQHIAASAFFSNNIVLWNEAGYFDDPSAAKPLLHLWSLGVEEQFYLVWPLLMFWATRRGVRRPVLIGALVVASLGVSVALLANGNQPAAFYMAYSRLWQLALGGWLAAMIGSSGQPFGAYVAQRVFVDPTDEDRRLVNNALAVAGLALLLLSIVTLKSPLHPSWWSDGPHARIVAAVGLARRMLGSGADATLFPGWAAVAPTLGACCVIAAGSQAWVNRRLLSLTPMVWIGLISYPLYLWHWPLLSFLNITERGHASRTLIAEAVVLSIVLASLTYLIVELPVRRMLTPLQWRRALLIVAPLFLMGTTALAASSLHLLLPPARVATGIDDHVPRAWHEGECRDVLGFTGGYCQQWLPTGPAVTTALFGDSHASQYFPGLGRLLEARGENLVHVGQIECPPGLDLERMQVTGDWTCTRVNRAAFESLSRLPQLRHVIVAFRGVYAAGVADRYRVSGTTIEGFDAITTSIDRTITALQGRGWRVTTVMPVPELGFDIRECTGRPWSLQPLPRREPCGVPKPDAVVQHQRYREFLQQYAAAHHVELIDPLNVLCDDRFCSAIKDGQAIYSDDNHLGLRGSVVAASLFGIQ